MNDSKCSNITNNYNNYNYFIKKMFYNKINNSNKLKSTTCITKIKKTYNNNFYNNNINTDITLSCIDQYSMLYNNYKNYKLNCKSNLSFNSNYNNIKHLSRISYKYLSKDFNDLETNNYVSLLNNNSDLKSFNIDSKNYKKDNNINIIKDKDKLLLSKKELYYNNALFNNSDCALNKIKNRSKFIKTNIRLNNANISYINFIQNINNKTNNSTSILYSSLDNQNIDEGPINIASIKLDKFNKYIDANKNAKDNNIEKLKKHKNKKSKNNNMIYLSFEPFITDSMLQNSCISSNKNYYKNERDINNSKIVNDSGCSLDINNLKINQSKSNIIIDNKSINEIEINNNSKFVIYKEDLSKSYNLNNLIPFKDLNTKKNSCINNNKYSLLITKDNINNNIKISEKDCSYIKDSEQHKNKLLSLDINSPNIKLEINKFNNIKKIEICNLTRNIKNKKEQLFSPKNRYSTNEQMMFINKNKISKVKKLIVRNIVKQVNNSKIEERKIDIKYKNSICYNTMFNVKKNKSINKTKSTLLSTSHKHNILYNNIQVKRRVVFNSNLKNKFSYNKNLLNNLGAINSKKKHENNLNNRIFNNFKQNENNLYGKNYLNLFNNNKRNDIKKYSFNKNYSNNIKFIKFLDKKNVKINTNLNNSKSNFKPITTPQSFNISNKFKYFNSNLNNNNNKQNIISKIKHCNSVNKNIKMKFYKKNLNFNKTNINTCNITNNKKTFNKNYNNNHLNKEFNTSSNINKILFNKTNTNKNDLKNKTNNLNCNKMLENKHYQQKHIIAKNINKNNIKIFKKQINSKYKASIFLNNKQDSLKSNKHSFVQKSLTNSSLSNKKNHKVLNTIKKRSDYNNYLKIINKNQINKNNYNNKLSHIEINLDCSIDVKNNSKSNIMSNKNSSTNKNRIVLNNLYNDNVGFKNTNFKNKYATSKLVSDRSRSANNFNTYFENLKVNTYSNNKCLKRSNVIYDDNKSNLLFKNKQENKIKVNQSTFKCISNKKNNVNSNLKSNKNIFNLSVNLNVNIDYNII